MYVEGDTDSLSSAAEGNRSVPDIRWENDGHSRFRADRLDPRLATQRRNPVSRTIELDPAGPRVLARFRVWYSDIINPAHPTKIVEMGGLVVRAAEQIAPDIKIIGARLSGQVWM